MDQKRHWAYPALTRPGLTRAQLLVHFRHEYLTYVRDFPVLVARALGQTPPIDDVRIALSENIYEEQTGGLSRTAPHPRLFLKMMAGLGFSPDALTDDGAVASPHDHAARLHPAAVAYRAMLRELSAAEPWQAAIALLTIFVEGSVHERAELRGGYVRPSGDADILAHPLVVHYGCPPEAMEIRRAHGAVEGGHRRDAWRIVVAHVPSEGDLADHIVATCESALSMWLRYRDGVAEYMGLCPEDADARAAVG